MDYPIWKLSMFCTLKTLFLESKNHSFYPEYQKTIFSDLISPKKTKTRKILIFGQKRWIIPLGKCLCFEVFRISIFWSKNHSFLSKISKNNL